MERMKKRNLLLPMLLIFAIGFSYCNKNGEKPEELEDPKIKWFPVGATWCYEYSGRPDRIRQAVFTVEKDTVVDGRVCQIIRSENSTDIVYEENGSVYYYFKDKFRKIYDFNVNVGDTVEFEFKAVTYSPFHMDTTRVMPCRVLRISTILVNGVEIRKISTSCEWYSSVNYGHEYYDKMGMLSTMSVAEGIFPTVYALSTADQLTNMHWYQDFDIEYVGVFSNRCVPDWWGVRFKLKPQTNENYIITKDQKMKALSAKHNVTLELYSGSFYYLTGRGSNKEDTINDFLATGKFENEYWDIK